MLIDFSRLSDICNEWMTTKATVFSNSEVPIIVPSRAKLLYLVLKYLIVFMLLRHTAGNIHYFISFHNTALMAAIAILTAVYLFNKYKMKQTNFFTKSRKM